jgi:hypothetical protein
LGHLREGRPTSSYLDQLDLGRVEVYGAVQRIADAWTRPPGTVADVIAVLERDGLVRTAAALAPDVAL